MKLRPAHVALLILGSAVLAEVGRRALAPALGLVELAEPDEHEDRPAPELVRATLDRARQIIHEEGGRRSEHQG